jgi:hypothetical protein
MNIIGDIVNIFGLLGYLFAIMSFLYFNKIKVFIWVNKIFSWKKDVNFELSLVAANKDVNLEAVLRTFRESINYESKIMMRSNNKIIFSLDTLIVEIRNDDFPEMEYNFEILIKNMNSSYSVAEKNLKILQKIFNTIIYDLELKNVKFTFKSVFPKNNPFLGPAVTKIGVDKIKRFYMIVSTEAFTNKLYNGEKIQVNLNEISYVDNNFEDLRDVANIILSI